MIIGYKVKITNSIVSSNTHYFVKESSVERTNTSDTLKPLGAAMIYWWLFCCVMFKKKTEKGL